MSRPILLAILVGGSVLLMLLAWVLLSMMRRQDLRTARIEAICRRPGGAAAEPTEATARNRYLQILRSIGQALSSTGILSKKTLQEISQTLAVAGFRQESAISIFIGAKLVSMTALTAVFVSAAALFPRIPLNHTIIVAAGAIVGMLLPDMIISRLRTRRLSKTELGLPDALDMLIICSEAGLGLEAGIERVCVEIEAARPEIAAELTITSAELRMSSDRSGALKNMGNRTGIEALKRLGVTLIQTMQYGTPLNEALRVLSAEMRHEFLMRFETRAARLPVLLTLPMILFILPCVFIVVGGPAALGIFKMMGGK
jgi:tight adherence protein C